MGGRQSESESERDREGLVCSKTRVNDRLCCLVRVQPKHYSTLPEERCCLAAGLHERVIE